MSAGWSSPRSRAGNRSFIASARSSSLRGGWAVSATHTRTAPSSPAAARRVPSGLHATRHGGPRLEGEQLLAPVGVPHLARLSSLPVTMRLPSGLNATLIDTPGVSLEGEQSWPVRGVPHLAPSCPSCR